MKYIFETRMEVRDYECDIEGIVNNEYRYYDNDTTSEVMNENIHHF